MAKLVKSLLVTDQKSLLPEAVYMVDPLPMWHDEKFQPVQASLWPIGIGIVSRYVQPGWSVELRGPALTKTGKHHKTRTHTRSFGTGRGSSIELPDGRHILSLFTSEEILAFINEVRGDAERVMVDSGTVTKEIGYQWDVAVNPVHRVEMP